MRLKMELDQSGLPEISVTFEQDTSESEPYLSVKAQGFDSPAEVAQLLGDLAQSIWANVPNGVPMYSHESLKPTEDQASERPKPRPPFNPQPRHQRR